MYINLQYFPIIVLIHDLWFLFTEGESSDDVKKSVNNNHDKEEKKIAEDEKTAEKTKSDEISEISEEVDNKQDDRVNGEKSKERNDKDDDNAEIDEVKNGKLTCTSKNVTAYSCGIQVYWKTRFHGHFFWVKC